MITTQTHSNKVTYSTILKIDGRYIKLSHTRISAYPFLFAEPFTQPSFKDMFLHEREDFLPPIKGKGPGMMYELIKETNFNSKHNKWHELQWSEIKVENKGHYCILSNAIHSHQIAIPPSNTLRFDYITADRKYHLNCLEGEFPDAIEIKVNGK